MPDRQPPVDYIARTAEKYTALGFSPYGWLHSDAAPPFCRPSKPLSESRVGLVASGGVYAHGQIAFTYKDDLSYRRIEWNTPTSELRTTHFAYDLTDSRRDPNVVFPLAGMRALSDEGFIGEVAPQALTFMGGIYSARKVRETLATAIAEDFRAQEVDVALLVPV
jgi:D-proline reductase (dithiol) PrdB